MNKIRKDKEKLVTKLYKQGKSSREICQEGHISFRELGRIIRKLNGDKESKVASNQSKAYRMFAVGKPPITVAILLGLGSEEVKQYYYEFLSLTNMGNIVEILKDHGHYLPFLSEVVKKMKSHDFDESEVESLIDNMGDSKVFLNIRKRIQYEVNMLTIKRDDLLYFGGRSE